MTAYYFAYGSNMNPRRMHARGMPVARILPGRLSGFELVFNKRASGKQGIAYANIRYARDAQVEGLLYELQEPAAITTMDGYEGAPFRYSREVFHVHTPEGTLPGWVYVANRAMIGEDLLPDGHYIAHLLAGDEWLSAEYVQRIRRHPVAAADTPAPVDGLRFNV